MKNYLVRNSRTGREYDSFCRKSQNIHTNRTYIKYGDRLRFIKTLPRNEKSSEYEATLQSHIAFRGDKKILLDIQLSDRVNNNEAGVPHFCICISVFLFFNLLKFNCPKGKEALGRCMFLLSAFLDLHQDTTNEAKLSMVFTMFQINFLRTTAISGL